MPCMVVVHFFVLIESRGDLPTDETKTRSIIFFVMGFWLLDFSTNTGIYALSCPRTSFNCL